MPIARATRRITPQANGRVLRPSLKLAAANMVVHNRLHP
jgi:hypothetical protein